MSQIIKKLESENMDHDQNSIISYQKANNNISEQWSRFVKAFKEFSDRHLHRFKKVDGISLWKINYRLNKLADKGISKEVLEAGKIIIPLPPKQANGITSDNQKANIEKVIDELEGFENLRLSQFYNYNPVYREKVVIAEVSRWIEIEIKML